MKINGWVIKDINLLLIEHKGNIGEYWPEVVAIRTKRSEVCTKMTEGQYGLSKLEQARLVSSLFYGIIFLGKETSVVLATCLAFFRFTLWVFCFLFLDFLFIAEKGCLNAALQVSWS